ncbi:MAG TPA: hypothetical protein IGS53_20660 [Leptolyngbyaceae cyanobacterium M33_DOE_097]|nr:hypothetical protein [Leptolyngbyaceae cyanobacterium M33_DOE_097]
MRFKPVGCLSTALIYCIGLNSVAAIEIVSQQGSRSTETFVSTDPFRIIEREQRRLEREQRKREREERTERRRQEREQRRLERQQELERRQRELEAAKKAATEEQRLEAEQLRQHFESLSPEAKKAYLDEQQAQRAQANKTAALFLLMLFAGGSGSNQQEGGRSVTCWEYGPDGSNRPYQVYVKAGERPPSSNCDG